jgi:hypothetical protein
VTRIDQARHRDQRVRDATDGIRHAVIMHAIVAALEHRMNEDDRTEFIRRFPERRKSSGSSRTPPLPFG